MNSIKENLPAFIPDIVGADVRLTRIPRKRFEPPHVGSYGFDVHALDLF